MFKLGPMWMMPASPQIEPEKGNQRKYVSEAKFHFDAKYARERARDG